MKYSWKLDNFDSEVLGFKVAKILEIESERYLKDLINELVKNEIAYATYRIETNNLPLVHALQKSDFLIVDGIISLEIDLKSLEINLSPRNESNHPEVREAGKKDLEELKRISSGLYVLSRIYNDSLISKKTADNFFMKWVENSIKGEVADSVLVWDEDGKILGYITLQKKGQIPLIGVSKEARGKGIGKNLILSSFNKFKEWEVEKVRIETQVSNIAALRLDLDLGFKPVSSYFTLRWANNV